MKTIHPQIQELGNDQAQTRECNRTKAQLGQSAEGRGRRRRAKGNGGHAVLLRNSLCRWWQNIYEMWGKLIYASKKLNKLH